MHLFISGTVPDLTPSFCSVRLLLDVVEIIENRYIRRRKKRGRKTSTNLTLYSGASTK